MNSVPANDHALIAALRRAGRILPAALALGVLHGLWRSMHGGYLEDGLWALVGTALRQTADHAMAWGLLAAAIALLVQLLLGLLPSRRWRLIGAALFCLLFVLEAWGLRLAAASFLGQRLPTSYVGIDQGVLFRSTIWPAFDLAVSRFGWLVWSLVIGLALITALFSTALVWIVSKLARAPRSARLNTRFNPLRAWPVAAGLGGWALVAALALLLRPAPPIGAPSVLLISIDTLRADHLGCYGYCPPTSPKIDALSSEAVLFEQAVSLSPYTLPSHVSMLSGLNPLVHGVTTLDKRMPESMTLLSEVFAAAGFDTGAAVSNFLLGPTYGFAQGFAVYDFFPDRTAEVAAAAAQRFYEQRAGAQRPSFFFLHLMDPHFPYTAPPQQRAMFNGADAADFDQSLPFFEFRDRYRRAEPGVRHELVAAYDAEIRYTDEVLGGLLDQLKQLGLYDSMLIVVTSDHGEEFWEHGGLGHSVTLYDEVLHVPLIVRLPGAASAGLRIETQVRLSDLTATLAAKAGTAMPGQAEGRDLSSLIAGRGPSGLSVPALAMTDLFGPPRYSRRTTGLKWISSSRFQLGAEEDSFPERMFDLALDPGELRNLAPEQSAAVATLAAQARAEIEALTQLGTTIGREAAPKLDPLTRQRLKALGYLQ
ncbi:MAG: sulfatase [Candidatus Alcyoniella australis]|nr:sulfatase [Candidatus Alcyoniella australis]